MCNTSIAPRCTNLILYMCKYCKQFIWTVWWIDKWTAKSKFANITQVIGMSILNSDFNMQYTSKLHIAWIAQYSSDNALDGALLWVKIVSEQLLFSEENIQLSIFLWIIAAMYMCVSTLFSSNLHLTRQLHVIPYTLTSNAESRSEKGKYSTNVGIEMGKKLRE